MIEKRLESRVFLRDDIENMLRGIAFAALPAGAGEYQAGFQAALIAVAFALNIPVDALFPGTPWPSQAGAAWPRRREIE